MLADTAKMRGCVIHTIGMSVPTEAVMKKMPHRQSAFLDVGCDFVAVTAWMIVPGFVDASVLGLVLQP